jgi:hypothetical protein
MTMGISEYDILTNTQPFAEDLGLECTNTNEIKTVRVEWDGDGTSVEDFQTKNIKQPLPVDYQLFGFFDE